MGDVEVKVDPPHRENGESSCEKSFLRACAVEVSPGSPSSPIKTRSVAAVRAETL